MPDWYVRRNSEGSAFPYQIRLGGCEYSLTEEEFQAMFDAFMEVADAVGACCIESEDYQDIVISKGSAKPSLLDILNLKPKEPMKRRI